MSSQSKYPLSIPFLCKAIVERQKFNHLRLSSVQKVSQIRNDRVFARAHGEREKVNKLLKEWDSLYEKLKPMCKNYSTIISYVRKQLGVRINWGTTSNIISFQTKDGGLITADEMEKMSQSFVLDELLFPELKVELPHSIEAVQKKYNALNYVTKEVRKNVKSK